MREYLFTSVPITEITIMHPEQKHIYQSMSPEKKLKAALRLYHSARKFKDAGLRAQHPDWSEERIRQALREYMLNART